MATFRSFLLYTMVLCVWMSIFMVEVEARRKILRGRKTITRTYYKKAALPAWSIIVLSGLGMLAVGGILYAVMRKIVIQAPPSHSYAPANQLP